MKKRIFAPIVIAAVISCMLILGFSVNAETVASVGNKSSGRGQEVTFEVTLNESVKVKSGAVSLIYDHTAMKLVDDAEKTGWTIDGVALATVDPRTEKGAFAFAKGTEISGTIFKVTFEVLDTAKSEKTDVACEIQLRDDSNKDIPVINNKGSITVVSETDAHTWDEGTVTKAATHTEDGVMTYKCTDCGEIRTEVIPGEGHTFGDWTVTKEATEAENGIREHTCGVCGYKETGEIPKLGAEPQTGDVIIIIVGVIAAAGTATVVILYTRKRKKT